MLFLPTFEKNVLMIRSGQIQRLLYKHYSIICSESMLMLMWLLTNTTVSTHCQGFSFLVSLQLAQKIYQGFEPNRSKKKAHIGNPGT